jgi:CelD/BcsL family acetyltransferase involved in cellulose biosynthesis
MLGSMTTHAPDAEPACPGTTDAGTAKHDTAAAPSAALRVRRCAFDTIPRATWDALAARNPWATPFSSWAFQRAWWDAYGGSAHDSTLLVTAAAGAAGGVEAGDPVAIVPLMHRHEVEPGDLATASKLRGTTAGRMTPVDATAKALFFGASYHSDYATLLGAPDDLPAVAQAVVDHLAGPEPSDPEHPAEWDIVDLRRLRCGDPAADALATAFGAREIAAGWTLNIEREDVCPVVPLVPGMAFDDYLSSLDKKARHETRRKIRRAESTGPIAFIREADPLAHLDAFIDMHQGKWAENGLFPDTPGGAASRLFLRRWFEETGPDGPVELYFLSVGERRIAAGILVDDGSRLMFWNAGVAAEARELSPGVLLAARCIELALERGRTAFDFLRGNEPYKYEWGARDEPIQRLLVRAARAGAAASAPEARH